VKEYLRYYSSPNTFSNALSPAQAAIVGKCFDIVTSEEGAMLRRKLMTNIMMLRELLHGCNLETYGDPSAIVCVKMGHESLARLTSRRLPSIGLLANLVEYPAVPKGRARFRLQVMANHTSRDIIDAVHRLTTATVAAQAEDEAIRAGTLNIEDLSPQPLVADAPAGDVASLVRVTAPQTDAEWEGEKLRAAAR
jgi:glycine C-acetyltransferase